MRNRTSIILSAVIMSFLGSSFTARPAQAVDDAIIAVVNDEVITLRDLRDYIRTTYVGLVAQGYPEERIKQIMLDLEINGVNNLIQDKLMLSKANELKLIVNEDKIDEKVRGVKNRYQSDQEFTESLIKHGANITDLRNKIAEQLKIKFVVDHEVRSKIYVNPKSVTEYYEKNKNQFVKSEQRMLDSIFIPYQEDPQAAKARAQEAMAALEAGEAFEDVAKKYSVAPPIGRVEKGQLMPSIETVVFGLKEGEVSKPVEVESGLYILKITKIIPEHIAGLSEVKDAITNILFNEKFQAKFDKWVDELKQNAYIEIKE